MAGPVNKYLHAKAGMDAELDRMLASEIPALEASGVLITEEADYPSSGNHDLNKLPHPNNNRKWYKCSREYTHYRPEFHENNSKDPQNVIDFMACAEVDTSLPDLELQYMCYYWIIDKLTWKSESER